MRLCEWLDVRVCVCAAGVFSHCHRNDDERAQMLLVRVSPHWGRTVCLQLALEASDKDFVAQSGVQVGNDLSELTSGRGQRDPAVLAKLCVSGSPHQDLVWGAFSGQPCVESSALHGRLPAHLHRVSDIQVWPSSLGGEFQWPALRVRGCICYFPQTR